MNIEELKKQDWFYDVGYDEYQRPVIYVHYMNVDIIDYIHNQYKNVLIHFASYKLASKDKYVNCIDLEPITEKDPLAELLSSFDRLRLMYDKNLLENIFYEVHDGKNSITEYSAMVPQLREEMEKLYHIYGFDVLYEELSLIK